MAVGAALRQAVLKMRDIAPESLSRAQPYRLADGIQPGASGRFVEGKKGAAQHVARAGLVVFRVEEGGERVARVALISDGQIGQ
jgi:hypothetical protein